MAISKIITSSLTDDAVTSAKIGTDQVGADALSSSAISGAVDIPANSVGESELSVDYTAQSVPHIIPGTLYPAVAGNDINGTDIDTSHGSTYTYGELHTDGRKYYYTDIKGSKPIKDPRIGAHFGTQRHTARSLQLSEQETATHGKEVFTVDGREWFRAVQSTGGNSWYVTYDSNGNFIATNSDSTGGFLEITGFFNDINFISTTAADIGTDVDILVNGTSSVTDLSVGEASVTSPLLGRFVSGGSLINGGSTVSASLGSTPKINTLKFLIGSTGQQTRFHGIELIAQDTSSTANRSKIQIPAQNVVSFGKKFPISATADHYDPFSAKTDGSAWTSPTSGNNTANSAASWPTNIDTANSLGLENWVNGSSYYRPYNGGRVVKYVDSTGTIKTAVTVMPPNARSIANANNLSGGAEKGDDSAGNTSAAAPNDNYKPTFTDQTIATAEDLHEVAKTFHWREFGNGGSNGTITGSYPDASMIDTNERSIAYVMDDGLTGLVGDQVYDSAAYGLNRWDTGSKLYFTFIGTGITWNTSTVGMLHWAQNLPYGTHIVEFETSSSNADQGTLKIDGVTVKSDFANSGTSHIYRHHTFDDITFHQPKKPPIPEDACVIADYMLMADFVPVGAEGAQLISKGVRYSSASRDHFYDASGASFYSVGSDVNQPGGLRVASNGAISSGQSITHKLTYFGTDFVLNPYGDRFGTVTEDLNSDVGTSATIGTTDYDACVKHTGNNLGVNRMKNLKQNSGYFWASSVEIATPIHTSSHYQAFETPFLHELVGGDRNMEQTNLVCSPDGKTWDEVTRDTSYMGPSTQLVVAGDGGNMNDSSGLTDHRGFFSRFGLGHKNTAWAYDRAIILEDGLYDITLICTATAGQADVRIQRNNTTASQNASGTVYALIANDHSNQVQAEFHCIRGDYIYIDEANSSGKMYGGNQETGVKLIITKMS